MRMRSVSFLLALFACNHPEATHVPEAIDPHAAHSNARGGHTTPPEGPGAVQVSEATSSALGIRTEQAAGGAGQHSARAPATVAWDPLRVVRVSTQAGGLVRTLSLARPGDSVSKGQELAQIYQPDLRAAFAELLVAKGLGEPWLGAAKSRLLALGASSAEIDAALASGQAPETTTIRAPRSGVVLERFVAEGAWLAPGAPLALLGEPGALLVEAEVSGPAPAPGSSVTLRDPATGETWPATFSSALPTASAVGLRIRLQPVGVLPVGRPLVAEWQTAISGGVWVPREALVDTGERRVVFVEESPGNFVPRKVEIGARANARVQILSGVAEGDWVVVSGTFLLDSETQIGSMGHAGHGG